MRVVIVSSFHYPGDGVSTYSSNLADLLRRNGHEVAFFAMQDERNVPDPDSDLFVSHISFIEMNQSKNLRTGLNVLGRVVYSREARKMFGLLLDRFAPDLIHLQSFHHFISPSIIFEANARGIPLIFTLHDFKLICPNQSMVNDSTGEICEACKSGRFYMPILKRCKKNSIGASAMATIEAYAHKLMNVRGRINAFISPSEFLRNKFIEHRFPADDFYHIPNMLSDDVFAGDSSTGEYILFLGRVDVLKGVRELYKAAATVPEVPVKIAGRIFPTMADEVPSKLPPNVEYVGMKSGDELRQLTSGALAIAVPSTWYENQPFSILEAFAAGKPVIAADLGGMTELVQDERGILVKPGNVEELAAAMRWMWSHKEESLVMGRNARQYVKIAHGADEHYARIMELYSRLCAKAVARTVVH